MTRPATRREAIAAIYAGLGAPGWAAPNLDGLVDVLRDLSWLPEGAVEVAVPDLSALPGPDRAALLAVLHRAAAESQHRPLRLLLPG